MSKELLKDLKHHFKTDGWDLSLLIIQEAYKLSFYEMSRILHENNYYIYQNKKYGNLMFRPRKTNAKG